MKILTSAPFSQGSHQHFLPKGNYGGFLVVYEGVNVALGNTTLADLGDVEFNYNGETLINVPAKVIANLNDLYYGDQEFTNIAGGAVRASIFIPSGTFQDDKNVYNVSQEDRVNFKLDFSGLASLWASGFVRIYGITKQGAQNYLAKLVSFNQVSGGASSINNVYDVENVNAVYLDNVSITDNIKLSKDGKTIIDAETKDILAYSNLKHQVETAITMIAIEFTESKDVREAIGGMTEFSYKTNGAGVLDQYFASIVFTPKKAVATIQQAKVDIANKMRMVKNLPTVDGLPVGVKDGIYQSTDKSAI